MCVWPVSINSPPNSHTCPSANVSRRRIHAAADAVLCFDDAYSHSRLLQAVRCRSARRCRRRRSSTEVDARRGLGHAGDPTGCAGGRARRGKRWRPRPCTNVRREMSRVSDWQRSISSSRGWRAIDSRRRRGGATCGAARIDGVRDIAAYYRRREWCQIDRGASAQQTVRAALKRPVLKLPAASELLLQHRVGQLCCCQLRAKCHYSTELPALLLPAASQMPLQHRATSFTAPSSQLNCYQSGPFRNNVHGPTARARLTALQEPLLVTPLIEASAAWTPCRSHDPTLRVTKPGGGDHVPLVRPW